MSQRALVTGAGGFIGSHLVERLVADGWDVRALLRYNSQSNRGNLELVDSTVMDSVEVFWGDLRDGDAVLKAAEGCDTIFHLGALIAIPYSYVNPTDFVQVNVLGTTNILNAARRTDARRVVVTSTSEVYGTAQYVPIDEKHPLQGQSPYSASKIGADHMAESYYRSFDVPVGILRPFNTYGPRQSMRAIIPTIITQLLSRDVVELGNLTPRRDLTFVEDTVDGFVKMATADDVPFGTPINIGNGKDISIGELLELLKEITGSGAELKTDAARLRPEKSEVNQLLASADKAAATIGWTPNHTLTEGLTKTVAWVRDHLERFRADEYYV